MTTIHFGRSSHALFGALLALLFTGCSSLERSGLLSDRSLDYKTERQAEAELEVPPDLTGSTISESLKVPAASGAATRYSEYAGEGPTAGAANRGSAGNLLPGFKNVRFRKDGPVRWLEVDAPVNQIWSQIVAFWREAGVLLVEEDPVAGVMKTDWMENRANISGDFLTRTLRKVFDSVYSSGTLDQFRVRVEPGPGEGTSEIYLTHRGLEEKLPQGVAGPSDSSFWVYRGSDPDLEAEMLRRLMAFIGIAEERAEALLAQPQQAGPRSTLTKREQGAELRIDEPYSRGWRVVGIVLDRVGFAVEDRNRAEGLYYVRYDDPMEDAGKKEGFLSSLAFWRSDDEKPGERQFRIRLRPLGDEATLVDVVDDQGAPDRSATSTRILTLLHEEIR